MKLWLFVSCCKIFIFYKYVIEMRIHSGKIFWYFLIYLLFCVFLEVHFSRYKPRFDLAFFYVLTFYSAIGLFVIMISGNTWYLFLLGFSLVFLHLANHIKFISNGEPLGYYDLVGIENFSIAIKYLNYYHFIFIFCFVLFFLKFRRWFSIKFDNFLNLKIFICFFLSVLLTFPVVDSSLGRNVLPFFDKLFFNSWRWDSNVKRNGLVNHLYQTSNIKLPPKESDFFPEDELIEVGPNKIGNLYVVMCEACWDEDNLIGISSKLTSKGFYDFSLISPIYGGGTVNAAFEMLTGMSSKSDLNGIIYQGYADLMKDSINAYPSIFKSRRYVTYSLHNNIKTFWRRNLVAPKFGFDEFYGIESMNDDDSSRFPRDRIMYEKAMELIKKNEHIDKFFFMTTIYAHGSYKEVNGDMGFGDFSERVNVSVDDYLFFFERVIEDDPDATFLIFADHKPGLSDYFISKGYIKDFSDWKITGKIPAFIYSKNIGKELIGEFDNSTLYCFSNSFAKEVVGVINSPMQYLQENSLCDKNKLIDTNIVRYPSDLYYKFLLN